MPNETASQPPDNSDPRAQESRNSATGRLESDAGGGSTLPKWKPLPKPDFRIGFAIRSSLILAGLIAGCGAVVAIATIRHAERFDGSSIAIACAWCMAACVVPIWFKPLLRNGGTYQLAVVTWRLLFLLPAMSWGMAQTGASRNSFITTLLACYFLTLPLESWLLVRDAQRSRPS